MKWESQQPLAAKRVPSFETLDYNKIHGFPCSFYVMETQLIVHLFRVLYAAAPGPRRFYISELLRFFYGGWMEN
jgi:hypothetical protein